MYRSFCTNIDTTKNGRETENCRFRMSRCESLKSVTSVVGSCVLGFHFLGLSKQINWYNMYVFYGEYGEYGVGLINAFIYALKYCARFGFTRAEDWQQ